jgi:four helix bundle protein
VGKEKKLGRIVGDLKERTLTFGVDVLNLVAKFPQGTCGWTVGKQLGRCASSIGANVWEADAALTDAEFANKISIARKEANETEYWLEVGHRIHLVLVPNGSYDNLKTEAGELCRILGAIVSKTQSYIKRGKE